MLDDKLKELKKDIVSEQKSPLFRIMSIFNVDESRRRRFANNICAFHVGNGYILSVAHNLRSLAGFPPSLSENEYQFMISGLNKQQIELFNRIYILDNHTNKRYIISKLKEDEIRKLDTSIREKKYDNRWLTFYKKNICKPFLVIQFREDKFYQDKETTQKINPVYTFQEPVIFRNTFLLELELIHAFYNEDYSLYKIINVDSDVISKIPFLEIDYEVYTESKESFFCLQSAPINELGRLLNTAEIEGVLDHFNNFKDNIDGNYPMEGLRYLIKGYFRFGSSGAPYLKYDQQSKSLKINAIQSEACPIQLTIKNDRVGNFQYINAIASPINNVETKLKDLIK